METIKGILSGLLIGLLLGILIIGIFYGMGKQDKNDCLKWQLEASTYSAVYYITEIQKQQCDYFGIVIDAPVK